MNYKAILFGTVLCAVILQGCVALTCYECSGTGKDHDCRQELKVKDMTPVTCEENQDRCFKTEFGDEGEVTRGCQTKAYCDAYDCDNEDGCTFSECCDEYNCNSAVTNSVSALVIASVAILAVVAFK